MGTFFAYAEQYQSEAARKLRETEPPVFVAVVGKPRTFETDDGSVNVSLRPEHLAIVDASRDRWVTETAERTLERIARVDDEPNEHARWSANGGPSWYVKLRIRCWVPPMIPTLGPPRGIVPADIRDYGGDRRFGTVECISVTYHAHPHRRRGL